MIEATIITVLLLVTVWLAMRFIDNRNAGRLERDLARKLSPFAEMAKARNRDKEELWKALGGIRGVASLYWAAGAISTLANRVAKHEPEAQPAAQMVFLAAFELRILSLLSLAEAAMCWCLPEFPRAVAGATVRLYCDMVCILDVVEAIGSR